MYKKEFAYIWLLRWYIYIFLFFLNLSDDYEQDYAFKDVSRDANNPGKVYI